MRTLLRHWLVPGVVVVAVLLVSSAFLSSWLSGLARSEAADAAGIPLDRVRSDGLDIELTGFQDAGERDRAVEDVERLDSSWSVTGLLDGDASVSADGDGADNASGSGSDTDPDTDGGSEADGGQDDATDAAVDDDSADTDDSADDGATEEADSAGQTVDSTDQETEDEVDEAAVLIGVDAALGLDGVELTGTLADEGDREALVAAVTEEFGAEVVSNEIAIDPAAVEPTGGGVLTISGEAPSDSRAQRWLATMSDAADRSGLDLVDELMLSELAAELNALFELEPIEFAERSSALDSRSQATLDQAAEILGSTDGSERLLVVGHTDSDGGADGNQRLSEARARSVVEYLIGAGIEADRLDAVGRGEQELLVDPERTLNDKQRNRRIEWEPIP